MALLNVKSPQKGSIGLAFAIADQPSRVEINFDSCSSSNMLISHVVFEMSLLRPILIRPTSFDLYPSNIISQTFHYVSHYNSAVNPLYGSLFTSQLFLLHLLHLLLLLLLLLHLATPNFNKGHHTFPDYLLFQVIHFAHHYHSPFPPFFYVNVSMNEEHDDKRHS